MKIIVDVSYNKHYNHCPPLLRKLGTGIARVQIECKAREVMEQMRFSNKNHWRKIVRNISEANTNIGWNGRS